MDVNANELRAVFAALGVTKAAKWDAKTLTKRVNAAGGIAAYKDKGAKVGPPAAADLFRRIDAAQDKGALVRVVDGPAAAPPKAKPKPNPKPKAAAAPKPKAGRPAKGAKPAVPSDRKFWRDDGRPTADAPLSVWREYRVDHPAELTGKGAGIAKAVFDELRRAGEAGPDGKPVPVTKAALHAFLVAKYPDRDKAAMLTNLNNLIPTRFRNVYRIFVWTGPPADGAGKGYYVVGDGKKPQPKSGLQK